MNIPNKADPSIYKGLRENALRMQHSGLEGDGVSVVFMDWHVGNGTATVLAAADGTASVYLSSGGGYLGGGQRHSAIRQAALKAVGLATKLLPQFQKTEAIDLPAQEDVAFFARTGDGLYAATVREKKLRTGTDPFCALGGAMQTIITGYRLISQKPPAKV
jgi:hypothetical protein